MCEVNYTCSITDYWTDMSTSSITKLSIHVMRNLNGYDWTSSSSQDREIGTRFIYHHTLKQPKHTHSHTHTSNTTIIITTTIVETMVLKTLDIKQYGAIPEKQDEPHDCFSLLPWQCFQVVALWEGIHISTDYWIDKTELKIWGNKAR